MGGPKRALLALFGHLGVKGQSKNANLAATRKLQMKMGPTQLDYLTVMLDRKRGPLLAP